MAYIITTQSHGGRRWYMLRNGNRTTDRGRAWRYPTELAAANALIRQRLRVEIDSAWHHASVISAESLTPESLT